MIGKCDLLSLLCEKETPPVAPPEWRRSELRLEVRAPLELTVNSLVISSYTLNVALNSMCVFSRTNIIAGSIVSVSSPHYDKEWCGRVVHCTQTVGGWKIGIVGD